MHWNLTGNDQLLEFVELHKIQDNILTEKEIAIFINDFQISKNILAWNLICNPTLSHESLLANNKNSLHKSPNPVEHQWDILGLSSEIPL